MRRCETCEEKDCKHCPYLRNQLYYGYAELRWCFWRYLRMWGKKKTRHLYELLVQEEGEEWVVDALGEKLVEEICS